jgi:molybdopterin-guanine dinucleotide biosynthesis protein A
VPSAIILAGGRSRRMGRPKAWLAFGGAPLLVRVAAAVRPLVREIVVVAAAGQDLPALAARVVRDRVPELGPLPALALGLEAATWERAFVLGCDAALLRPAVLRLLAREHARHAGSATIPVWEGRRQPLVAVYERALAPLVAARAAAGERRLLAVADLPGVRLVPATLVREADPEGASFRAINTGEEYRAARRAWERRHRRAPRPPAAAARARGRIP